MIVESFEVVLNEVTTESLPRDYLGLSSIGTNCYRKLQHDHYWTYKSIHSAQLLRLFGVGHRMEEVIVSDLEKVGIHIVSDQDEVIGFAGHWKGHSDGIAFSENNIDQRFLTEYKTHNDKSFKDLIKKGVLASKPIHYDQVTAYMGYEALPFCLYVAYNKNDSTYFFEVIKFNGERFQELCKKQEEIILATDLLPRVGNDSITWFECKMCDAKQVCHGYKDPEKTCRTCNYVDIEPNGKWSCSFHDKNLTSDDQRKACDYHAYNKMFNI
jgi:hypothetical protein